MRKRKVPRDTDSHNTRSQEVMTATWRKKKESDKDRDIVSEIKRERKKKGC